MEQWMLPLHDVPLDQGKTMRPLTRSPARVHKPAKSLDRRFTTALADPARVLFLDVETTGLSWFYDELTILGWAIDRGYCLHIAGDDPGRVVNASRTAH